MTDLDARVAALAKVIDKYVSNPSTATCAVVLDAIRAELQKPALHEPCTELEALSALTQFETAADIYAGRVTPMQAAINFVLQGRAKPAQEEITDAERYRFAAQHCVLSGGGRFGWSIAPCTKSEWDRYLDAAIRASKGEKT